MKTTTYRTVLADPPWQYDDKLRMSDVTRGSSDNYSTLTVDEICDFGNTGVCRETMDVAGHLLEDEGFLWLWVTNAFLLDGSGVKVCRAWGFTPKQIVTWVKTKKGAWSDIADSITEGWAGEVDPEDGEPVSGAIEQLDRTMVTDEAMNEHGLQMGMGRITRGATEQMIVATRGQYTQHVKVKNRRNAIFAPRRAHSQKPEEQYELIEAVCPGPYLELFARQRRDGWDAWGKAI